MFALGATSKVLAALVTYPGQVLKTRLQQDAEVTGTERYQSVRTTIARIIRCAPSFARLLPPRTVR